MTVALKRRTIVYFADYGCHRRSFYKPLPAYDARLRRYEQQSYGGDHSTDTVQANIFAQLPPLANGSNCWILIVSSRS